MTSTGSGFSPSSASSTNAVVQSTRRSRSATVAGVIPPCTPFGARTLVSRKIRSARAGGTDAEDQIVLGLARLEELCRRGEKLLDHLVPLDLQRAHLAVEFSQRRADQAWRTRAEIRIPVSTTV